MNELINFLLAKDQIFTTVILIVLIIFLIVSIMMDKLKKYQDLDTNKAVDLMEDSNAIILDIRTEKERNTGFIANDMHIPSANVKNKLTDLDKDKKILIYCNNGSKSPHIAGLLTKNDFKNVYVLKGGMKAWLKSNLPIKNNTKNKSKIKKISKSK
jgi:rhodanese-related sulfurtransferase